jgi:peptidoglycan hydrolase-like protein with peptidoglycan-binding domain
MLSVGSSGANVKKAQELLNKKTILPPGEKLLVADGKFGPMTSNRVRLYQIQNKLNASGNIDDATASKLGLSASDIVPVKITQPAVVTSSTIQIPEIAEPSFFEKHKKNIMIVGGGLALVLGVVFIVTRSGASSAPVVKPNPKKRGRK